MEMGEQAMCVVPLHESVAHWARVQPDKPAVQTAGEGAAITYGQLAARVAAAAAGLTALGATAGRAVCIASDNAEQHLIASIAAMAVGAVPVALPHNPAAAAEIVEDCRPSVIVGEGDLGGASLQRLEELGRAAPDALLHRPGPDDLAMIYYTSGTSSGVRKGVLQPYRQLEATARYIIELMRFSGEAVEFVASPVDNAFWFGRCRVVLRAGGTLVLNSGSLSPQRILDAVMRHQCNSLSGDTPIFVMLLTGMAKKLALVAPQLRWAKVASQAMASGLKTELVRLLSGAHVVMNYGLTEAMRCCIIPIRDHPDKLEAVGRPCPGVEIRILGPGGEVLAADTLGAIQVRGVNLAAGYLNKPEMWAERMTDGWYNTGDVGSIDGDGFVTVRGRLDEAFNVGGRTVSPYEVEEALRPYLPNTRYCVCGVADPRKVLGEVAALCIAPAWSEPSPWPDVRTRLLADLPGALVPRLVYVFDEIPLTVNGKPRRAAVKESIAAGACEGLSAI